MEQAQSENTKDFSLTQYQKNLKEPMPENGACGPVLQNERYEKQDLPGVLRFFREYERIL
jgi:hypothetical protein